MTLVLAGLCLSLLATLVTVIVNSRRERETMLGAVQMAVSAGNTEREIHAKTLREMATHIQQPEAAPFIDQATKLTKQYVSAENDEEFWESIEDNGAGG